ncbi:MAG: STAS domain-containing protein [Gammaproteobacteria bacterium]|nr:STAS domain-containing protein [Gammaproteobacteria bacterium]
MSIKTYARNGKCKIKVEVDMTIYTTADLMPKILKSLDKHKELVIDLSDVFEIDTSGIQLLEFIKREARRDNKVFSMVSHKENVLDVFHLYRLNGQLDAIPDNSVSEIKVA